MTNLLVNIAVFSFICLGVLLPVRSEMGPAVSPVLPPLDITGKSFDGWCRSKYNDCSISIAEDYILIDSKYKVKREQITSWSRNDEFRDASGFIGQHHLYTYEFRYQRSDGIYERGWIIFQNAKASDRFYVSIKKWAAAKELICQYNFDSRRVICN